MLGPAPAGSTGHRPDTRDVLDAPKPPASTSILTAIRWYTGSHSVLGGDETIETDVGVTKPKVSVIIPCLNAAETLGEQLAAVEGQRWEGTWEVLVADNGSVDASVDMGRSYVDRL